MSGTAWTPGANSLLARDERAGEHRSPLKCVARGLAGETVGLVLTIGWIFASLGALAVVAIGDRWGSAKPFLFGVALAIIALATLQHPSALAFAIGAGLLLAAGVFAAVYAIALITTLNTHPLYAGLGAVALQAAIAAGPPIGGHLFEHQGTGGAYLFAACCLAFSAVLYCAANAAAARRTAAAVEVLPA